MEKVSSKDLAIEICKAMSDKLGKDIIVLYVREKTDLCDYFVIASGSNAPQIKAMGERVEEPVLITDGTLITEKTDVALIAATAL